MLLLQAIRDSLVGTNPDDGAGDLASERSAQPREESRQSTPLYQRRSLRIMFFLLDFNQGIIFSRVRWTLGLGRT